MLALARWIIGFTTLLLGVGSAHAADISFEEGDDGFNIIMISGEIASGDENHFRRLALGSGTAVVVLNSPGGSLLPALEIGRVIQLQGFSTYVPDKLECTSACALIWIAGSDRFMASTARVGFHASYRDNDGQLQEVGLANAMVGRYLTLLNLPERAVIFATAASPTEILWLNSDNARTVGIPFETLDLETGSSPNEETGSGYVATPSPSHGSAPMPIWYYAGEGNDGTLLYVRGDDVDAGRADSRHARMWMRMNTAHVRGSTADFVLALYIVDCVAETYRTESLTEYAKSGVATALTVSGRTEYILPGSLMEEATNLVCSDDYPSADERDLFE